ncbi:hypothetical protein BZA70DRAFT_272646 [Myxozyma melibiosi]|uniref:Ankyrin n=1 Tax=Myxozyma melibiosi TaxID=54550 RepID=A0ABR1FDQ6_9ASCO
MSTPPDNTVCDLCGESIWIPNPALADSSDDDEDMDLEDSSHAHGDSSSHAHSGSEPALVPDDVVLNLCPVKHHFHWTCFLAHTAPDTFCPSCRAQLIPDDPAAPLLATVRSDGGVETDYDLRQTLKEERLYAQYPNLRLHEALCDACFTGDEERVWQLLEGNPDEGDEVVTDLPEAKDLEKGWTPLFYAAVSGREGIARFLIEKGVDRSARDKYGRIAAEYAREEGHENIVRLLME